MLCSPFAGSKSFDWNYCHLVVKDAITAEKDSIEYNLWSNKIPEYIIHRSHFWSFIFESHGLLLHF